MREKKIKKNVCFNVAKPFRWFEFKRVMNSNFNGLKIV